jgi:hypothetical protein
MDVKSAIAPKIRKDTRPNRRAGFHLPNFRKMLFKSSPASRVKIKITGTICRNWENLSTARSSKGDRPMRGRLRIFVFKNSIAAAAMKRA